MSVTARCMERGQKSAVSALKCGLLPLTQTGMCFLRIGYYD